MGSGASNHRIQPAEKQEMAQTTSNDEVTIRIGPKISLEDVRYVKKCVARLPMKFDTSSLSPNNVHELLFETDGTVIQLYQKCDNFYVIHSGVCRILFEDEKDTDIEVALLGRGSVFGAETAFYGTTNNETIAAKSGTRILYFTRNLVKPVDTVISLPQWIVTARMYHSVIDTTIPQHKETLQTLLTCCLRDTGLFHKWTSTALASLAKKINLRQLWLLPTNSILVQNGDRADSKTLFVLCKGKLQARAKPLNMTAIIQALRFPFVIGEENFFTGRKYKMTLTALVPSFVLILGKSEIEREITEVNGLRLKRNWHLMKKSWTEERTNASSRKLDIPQEILLVKLRSSPSFKNCSPIFIQYCLKNAYCACFEKDEIINMDENGVSFHTHAIQVIEGKIELRISGETSRGIDNASTCFGLDRPLKISNDCKLVVASSYSVVILIRVSSIEEALTSQPGNTLFVG